MCLTCYLVSVPLRFLGILVTRRFISSIIGRITPVSPETLILEPFPLSCPVFLFVLVLVRKRNLEDRSLYDHREITLPYPQVLFLVRTKYIHNPYVQIYLNRLDVYLYIILN